MTQPSMQLRYHQNRTPLSVLRGLAGELAGAAGAGHKRQ